MQSMRQLEYQWNRKYQYPWVFFNDEPFSDEFKVGNLLYRISKSADSHAGRDPKPYLRQMLLRDRSKRALVTSGLDR